MKGAINTATGEPVQLLCSRTFYHSSVNFPAVVTRSLRFLSSIMIKTIIKIQKLNVVRCAFVLTYLCTTLITFIIGVSLADKSEKFLKTENILYRYYKIIQGR